MIKTRTWILCLAGLAVVLAVLSLRFFFPEQSAVAEVVQDGATIRRIDLSRVAAEETFTVASADGGSNTVVVQPGRIRVLEADCPDQICVQHGWLGSSGGPIVCLPHRLVIRLQDAAGDGVSQ